MPTMWLSDSQSKLVVSAYRIASNADLNVEIGVAFCSGGR
jgi:hypothetical protein